MGEVITSSRISIPDDQKHTREVNDVTCIVQQQRSPPASRLYELSYFFNTISAMTLLGALLPVHNSNWT